MSFFKMFLICSLILGFCKENKQPHQDHLTFLYEKAISVPEPSGLDLTFNKAGFWTVSDETSTVYRLDGDGNVVQRIEVSGFDLEGITVVDETKLVVILERSREVVMIDTNGSEIKRKKLPLEGEENSGIEGISYNSENGHYYLVNEKNPLLFIELDANFDIIKTDTLTFSKDVSGIYYDQDDNKFWILSDEDQQIIQRDFDGNILKIFHLNIIQPEGITVDKRSHRLYIISDAKETLYVFKIE